MNRIHISKSESNKRIYILIISNIDFFDLDPVRFVSTLIVLHPYFAFNKRIYILIISNIDFFDLDPVRFVSTLIVLHRENRGRRISNYREALEQFQLRRREDREDYSTITISATRN